MNPYFVYVSGEHVELARAEVDTLLNQFASVSKLQWNGRIAIIESDTDPSGNILERAALVQMAGEILCECEDARDVLEVISNDVWQCYITAVDTFSVKTFDVNGSSELGLRLQIERDLGRHIKTVTGAGVSLKNPSIQILVMILPDKFLICKSNLSTLRPLLRAREPGKKLFFHPSMMNSTLARVMCNLAGVRKEDIVLDPFCGGGGILCEAAYIGASVVGVDLSWKLLVGATKNLSAISGQYSLIQADSQHIPICRVDRIVTDPPYGRASSTRGNIAIKLVESLLGNIDSIVQTRGVSSCICGDSEMNLPQIIEEAGLTVDNQIKIRVHSGLLREIVTVIT